MRGSLRLRHQADCPGGRQGRTRDPRACRCTPAVQGRIAGVERTLGHLSHGWVKADLVVFEDKLADLRRLVLEGRPPPPNRIVTLEEWARGWFEQIAVQVELEKMSPLTYNKYESDWRLHIGPAFAALPLTAIDHDAIVRFMRTQLMKGLSEATVKNSLVVLSGMLTDAMSADLIARNPLRTPKRARHRGGSRHDVFDMQVARKPPQHLEPVEARALLFATPPQFRDMVLCALTTGFRRNELLALQWEWIDFGARRIELQGQLYWKRVGDGAEREATIRSCKYDSEREVPLWSGLADLLGKRREATGYVFRNPQTGGPWKEGRPAATFLADAYETAELRRPGRMWHQLRHTYASVLAAGGVKRHAVEQLMGHATQGTTGLYTHLFRESYDEVHRGLDAVYGDQPLRRQRSSPTRTRGGGAARF